MSYKKILLSAGALTLFAVAALPALAQVYSPSPSSSPEAATTTVKGKRADIKAQAETNLIARIKEKANQEIDRRIESLNKLSARVQAMGKVSAGEKASIAASVQSEVASLTALKTKIAADTDLETLRTDVKSITQAYRIYALIIPMGNIAAAADRLLSLADAMAAIEAKLETRVATTAVSGAASLQAALTDMKAKIADARIQAGKATTSIASLVPDLGNQDKFQANKSALQAARTNIRTGLKDLKDARADAKTVTNGLKVRGGSGETATTTPSASPTASPTPTATATPAAQ